MQSDFQVTNICDLKSGSADAIANASIGTLRLGCEENKYHLGLRVTNLMYVECTSSNWQNDKCLPQVV
jgi:predicted HTH transcriptional regulator